MYHTCVLDESPKSVKVLSPDGVKIQSFHCAQSASLLTGTEGLVSGRPHGSSPGTIRLPIIKLCTGLFMPLSLHIVSYPTSVILLPRR